MKNDNDLFSGFAELIQTARTANSRFSFRERIERIATDSVFHYFYYLYTYWRYQSVTKKNRFRESIIGKKYKKANRRLLYSRPLTDKGLATYNKLAEHGIDRRNLRLIVFCKFIKEDGSIKINWWKESILEAVSWFTVFLFTFAWLDLSITIALSSSALLGKFIVIATSFILFLIFCYLIFIQGALSARAARKINNFQ